MTINAYPLQWPVGWKRTDHSQRREGRFGKARERIAPDKVLPFRPVTMADAVARVLTELERMAVTRDDVVISTNVRTRMDGLPRSDQAAPSDPGVAVYWEESTGARRVMAIDQYDRVEDNLAAVAATLEAMRAIERHGGAIILERAFTGFTALPGPDTARPWRVVLGFDNHSGPISGELLKERWRSRASSEHPDKPMGSHSGMVEVNAAYDQARQELGV